MIGKQLLEVYSLKLTSAVLDKNIKNWLEENRNRRFIECPQIRWACETFQFLKEQCQIPTIRFAELMGANTPSERPQDIYDELMGLPERYKEIRRSNFKPDTLVKFVRSVAFIALESGGDSTAKHVLAKRHFNAIEKALLPLA